jgi:RNA polymerase sigma factor (sigma-70 family)
MEHPGQNYTRSRQRDLDGEVWQDFLQHGERAFPALYEAFFDRLYIYGCNIVHDETFVKDAIQEIFLKLLQRDRETLDIQNISSYLFVALRNYLRKDLYARENKRRHQERFLEGQPLTEEAASFQLSVQGEGSFVEMVKREVNNLPARQREILFLRFFEGLDYKEISQIMSVNHQVVRNYAYRGMKKLRKNMEGIYPQFQSWGPFLVILMTGCL